jgi:hypothetical protein
MAAVSQNRKSSKGKAGEKDECQDEAVHRPQSSSRSLFAVVPDHFADLV